MRNVIRKFTKNCTWQILNKLHHKEVVSRWSLGGFSVGGQ